MIERSLPLFLLACTATVDPEHTDDTEVIRSEYALVTTVSDDYATGSFAVVGVDDWGVADDLFPTSGDAGVVVDDGRVMQINRFGFDSVRVYAPGDWSQPATEFSVGTGANPQDAAICDGKLFVSLYELDHLGVYDPDTGASLGVVDLSDHDDGDGPEAASMVEVGGKLYVGLNRLDRSGDWWTDNGGQVVEVDCAAQTATRAWDAGGNTTVHAWPDTGKLLVGVRGFDGTPGGVYALDPDADELSLVVDGDAMGWSFDTVLAWGDHAVLVGYDEAFDSGLACVDLASNQVTWSATSDRFLGGGAVSSDGEAWIVARPSWNAPELAGGLQVLDIETCTDRTADGRIETNLPPYGVAFGTW